ncbi:S8 family serine peptidase [bacterium]|nr:S8 family serine peptidase [bacterium]
MKNKQLNFTKLLFLILTFVFFDTIAAYSNSISTNDLFITQQKRKGIDLAKKIKRLSNDTSNRIKPGKTYLLNENYIYPVQQRPSQLSRTINKNIPIQEKKLTKASSFQIRNLNAIKTLSIDKLWPEAGGEFSLTGKNIRLGIWDGGNILINHQEINGRAFWKDPNFPSEEVNTHASHVSGTMIASGVDFRAKGSAPESELWAYTFNNDINETVLDAPSNGIYASNHSYGVASGWYFDGSFYVWLGNTQISNEEDYTFGFYNQESVDWDTFLNLNDTYVAVIAVGNEREETLDAQGKIDGHFHFNFLDNTLYTDFDDHEIDGGDDGYDSIPMGHAIAKNTISVGAIFDIASGYSSEDDIEIPYFSSWGPTDDGRIKPDFVSNGVSLYSIGTNDTSYASMSGTSMAAPSFTGGLALLYEHHETLNPTANKLLASTIKAILIQSANDNSIPGPDYQTGWGLPNFLKAAELMAENKTNDHLNIIESTLEENQVITFNIKSKKDALKLTLCWTDHPGQKSTNELNPTTKRLVNDLDIRVIDTETNDVYFPWILPFQNQIGGPDALAITGDNNTDNTEQINIETPDEKTFEVQISHKNTLSSEFLPIQQSFSLVISNIQSIPEDDTSNSDDSETDGSTDENDSNEEVEEEEEEEEEEEIENIPLTIYGQTGEDSPILPFPNPFNPKNETTQIKYTLSKNADISLHIYSRIGEKMITLTKYSGMDGGSSGDQEIEWNGHDENGNQLPNDVYIGYLIANDGSSQLVKKVKIMVIE